MKFSQQQHRRAPLSVRLLMVFSTLERGKVKHLPQISASVGCELSEDTEKDKYCYKFHCDAPRATCRRWLASWFSVKNSPLLLALTQKVFDFQ
jgi:hypothetical protein